MREILNTALKRMNPLFEAMYATSGRDSIAPEKLLRALMLQVLYGVRSERMLVEQQGYNLLFRWFVGVSIHDAPWVPSTFSMNRDRLIEHDACGALFKEVLAQARSKGLPSGSISRWTARWFAPGPRRRASCPRTARRRRRPARTLTGSRISKGSRAAHRNESDAQDENVFQEIDMKAPTKAKRAPERDLFAELSEGMTALTEARQGKHTLRAHGATLEATGKTESAEIEHPRGFTGGM